MSETQTLAKTSTIPKPILKSRCYLTFDDGPNTNTGAILDALVSAQVKATFYLTGKNLQGNSSLQFRFIKRMIDEGHDLGNHGYDHDPMRRREYKSSKPADVQKDFEDNETLLRKLFAKEGQKFPGFTSARLPGDGRFQVKYVEMIQSKVKLAHVSWDMEFSYNDRFGHLEAKDWQGVKGVASSHSGFPKAENIILLHDSHWAGKIDLFIKMINKLKTKCNLTSLGQLPKGHRQIKYLP